MRMKKPSRMVIVGAVASIVGLCAAVVLVAATPQVQVKRKLPPDVLTGAATKALMPDLIAVLQVATSCGTPEVNARLAAATPPQFYIKGITALVYNRGGLASDAGATGMVRFRDYRTNANKIFNFSVGAVAPKTWGIVTPAPLSSDEFYVATAQGIKLTVTYKGGTISTPVTHERTESACPPLL
jgi:hypothetical protein